LKEESLQRPRNQQNESVSLKRKSVQNSGNNQDPPIKKAPSPRFSNPVFGDRNVILTGSVVEISTKKT
jgi:hypothetical protein